MREKVIDVLGGDPQVSVGIDPDTGDAIVAAYSMNFDKFTVDFQEIRLPQAFLKKIARALNAAAREKPEAKIV